MAVAGAGCPPCVWRVRQLMRFSQRSYVCFLLVQNEYFTTEVFSVLNFSNSCVHIILKEVGLS